MRLADVCRTNVGVWAGAVRDESEAPAGSLSQNNVGGNTLIRKIFKRNNCRCIQFIFILYILKSFFLFLPQKKYFCVVMFTENKIILYETGKF